MDPAKPLRSDLALKFDAARLPLPPLSLQVPKRGNQTERAPRMHVCTNRENSAPRERAKKNNSAWALFCKMPTHLHFPQSRPARGGSRRRESLEAKSHLRVPAELPLVQSRYKKDGAGEDLFGRFHASGIYSTRAASDFSLSYLRPFGLSCLYQAQEGRPANSPWVRIGMATRCRLFTVPI